MKILAFFCRSRIILMRKTLEYAGSLSGQRKYSPSGQRKYRIVDFALFLVKIENTGSDTL